MEGKKSTCKKGEHKAYFVEQKEHQHLLVGENLTEQRVTADQNLDQKHTKTKTQHASEQKENMHEKNNRERKAKPRLQLKKCTATKPSTTGTELKNEQK